MTQESIQAALYRTRGAARAVLQVQALPLPTPAPGEVRVRVAFSGVNPSDVKSRASISAPMPAPFVVPHSDGAGSVDAVGAGVDPARVGESVWLYNAQWDRAWGSAAQAVCLPQGQAVALPAGVSLDVGASVGIPLMTAFHAVESCGALLGRTVVVTGAAGSVGLYVTQLATLAGARVIAVVSSAEKAAVACAAGADVSINYSSEAVGARVRELTGGQGADALIEVDAAGNARHWGEALAQGGRVVVYGSNQPEMPLPFRPLIMGFLDVYFFIVYRLPPVALQRTLAAVNALLARDALTHPETATYTLDDIAAAHERVERGANAKVLIAMS